MLLLAQIFNKYPALKVDIPPPKEIFVEETDSREERVYRGWINSLGITDVIVNNLFQDLRDGTVLIKVMNCIKPGLIDVKKQAHIPPKNRFHQVENCNLVIKYGKDLGTKYEGSIGGLDIVDGNRKMTLAVVWQLMRSYILSLLSSLRSNGKEVDENEIIQWSNVKVKENGCDMQISSFRDKQLGDGVYLLHLLSAIYKDSVNWQYVDNNTKGEMNGKYIISTARKIGAVVFLTWEDIVEVNPKILMAFVGGLMLVDMNKK